MNLIRISGKNEAFSLNTIGCACSIKKAATCNW